MKIVFLCSGDGGNLRFVDHAIRQGWLPKAHICAVWSDRACGAHHYAQQKGIPTQVLDFSVPEQEKLCLKLKRLEPDVVVSTLHRVLQAVFVDAFAGRLINLHYSLLPAFAGFVGRRPVERALEHGARFIGITVHHVEAQLDHGRPIVQAITEMPEIPQIDAVMNLLFRAGCIGLLHGVAATGHVLPPGQPIGLTTLAHRPVWFSPPVVMHPALVSDQEWSFLVN